MELIITDHAALRLKERAGIKNAKRRESFAEAAYMEGIRIDNCDRLSAKEILAHSKNEYREVVVYHDQLFIFEDNVLITVLPVNKEYKRIMEERRAKFNRTNAYSNAA